MKHKNIYILFILLGLNFSGFSQAKTTIDEELTGMRAVGSPSNPKVPMSWRKYHDYAQITNFVKDLEKAFPKLVKTESIGKSIQGRDIWAIKITDYTQGNADQKPAFYIDGGIHANEMNGVLVAMYTAWYLCENHAYIPFIQNLLKDRAFYILPTISPDSKDNFIYKPNTTSSSRSGMRPFDNDGDGSIDEDTYQDLDGDGHITMMRRKSKTGRFKKDPKYPTRMTMAQGDEMGEYEMLGSEGVDLDGDGMVNEDTEGGYDPNRDWAWNWQPHYVQNGALFYPGTLPETRAVKDFFLKHKNIAGAQSYHNFGGMFLRPPGAKEDEALISPSDIRTYDVIGKLGEKMIPGYNYYILYKDLYTVYGGAIDFMALTRGIFTFSNELNTSYKLFNSKSDLSRFENDEFNQFDKLMLFGDGYAEWKTYNHPQFGEIEIGGPKKNYIRNHPGFMMEEDAHRNMAFTLFHAYQMPKLEIVEVQKKDIGNGLTAITATIMNTRIIPTHSSIDVKNKISPPNIISIQGAKVIAGMTVENDDLNLFTEQKHSPDQIEISNIGNMSSVKVRWIVSGATTNAKVSVASLKGGNIDAEVEPKTKK